MSTGEFGTAPMHLGTPDPDAGRAGDGGSQNKPARKKRGETSLGDRVCDVVEELYASGILYAEGVREFKKKFLLRVLRAHDGNQFKAAIELNMHRNTLSRTIAELNLRDELEAIRNGR